MSLQLLVYCVMPNHWHLVVWPRHDGDLSRFMNWLTLTHSQRWHQYPIRLGKDMCIKADSNRFRWKPMTIC
ncbi:MAG: transposase [Nitrospiraceae bacterium]